MNVKRIITVGSYRLDVTMILITVILSFSYLFSQTNKVANAAETRREEEGEEVWDMMDTTEIQDVLDDLMVGDGFQFDGYVNELVTGEKGVSFDGFIQDALEAVKSEFVRNRDTMFRLLLIAVLAAVFTNFTSIFQGRQISETGFYITYILLFTVLTVSFLSVTTVATKTLNDLQGFMKALIPSYVMALAYTTGFQTSMVFYQATMYLILLVDVVLIRIAIPAIRVYFILSLSNHLMREERFTKMSDLLGDVISWGLKTLLGLVIGFHTIQGLIAPVSDGVKRSGITKAVGSIPGLGNMFSSAAETVMGAGLLVKNAIGVAGLMVVILICAIPVIKLLVYTLIYRFSAAIVQPISDKRILSCIGVAAESAKLLLFTVGIGAVMFLFSITIITMMTGKV